MRHTPNILLLLTDDQRFDALGALGNPCLHTPHMDALLNGGCSFDRCHIMGGTTGAVCCPSRAMLYTGRDLFQLTRHGGIIPEQDILLGEHLGAHGYRCCGIGKWHNGPNAFQRSFTCGNEIFFGGMADHWQVPCHRYRADGDYRPEHANARKGPHSTTIIAEAATDFLRHHESKTPFFCAVNFLAPHDPRTMPREYRDRQLAALPPLPPNFMPRHPFDNGELMIRDEMLADMPRRPEQIRRHIAEYYAMIEHLDHAIGYILSTLEDRGLADNTIVALAGDNGLAVGQHGLMGKQNCYEHSMRVPLILRGPGVPTGARRTQLCYLHDLFPTFCDLAGLPIPSSVSSQSLAPALTEPAATHRQDLLLAYRDCQRAVSDGRYKLIRYLVDDQQREQLFDLTADPWEMHDLIDDPAHAQTRQTYAQRLDALRRQHEPGLTEQA